MMGSRFIKLEACSGTAGDKKQLCKSRLGNCAHILVFSIRLLIPNNSQ